jgi:hypothetical protein
MIKKAAGTNVNLVVTLLVLNLLDFITTVYCMKMGGEEANPIMLYAIEYFDSVWGLLYAKIALLIWAVPYLAIAIYSPELVYAHSRAAFRAFIGYILIAINGVYFYVVAHNFYVLYVLATWKV